MAMPQGSLLKRAHQLLLSTGRTLAGRKSLLSMTSAVTSWTFYCLLESSWNPCDVTSVVATTSSLTFLSYCPKDISTGMFARLRRRFGRVDVDGEESRMNQTKPKSNGGHRTWSCGMGSKFWAVYVELPVRGVCGGFSWPL